ncbi:hypothetical protein [uncultured Croceitalea sp.]|uniref:hypothetical protein n=1 Tax=uncultured Croceitalea sp. TaxID=1798908 RepID=UPI0033061131
MRRNKCWLLVLLIFHGYLALCQDADYEEGSFKKIEESNWQYSLLETNVGELIYHCLCSQYGGIWSIHFLLNDEEKKNYYSDGNNYLKNLNDKVCRKPDTYLKRKIVVRGNGNNDSSVLLKSKQELVDYIKDFPPNCETEKFLTWEVPDTNFVKSYLMPAGIILDSILVEKIKNDNPYIVSEQKRSAALSLMKLNRCNNLYAVQSRNDGIKFIRLITRRMVISND